MTANEFIKHLMEFVSKHDCGDRPVASCKDACIFRPDDLQKEIVYTNPMYYTLVEDMDGFNDRVKIGMSVEDGKLLLLWFGE